MIDYRNIPAVVSVLFICPVVGGVLEGLGGKLSARMQNRTGSCILQSFYDVIKLFGKKQVRIYCFQRQFTAVYIMFTIIAFILFMFGQDLLLIFACIAFSEFCFIIANMFEKSANLWISIQRQTVQAVVYISLLFASAIGIKLSAGSCMVSNIYNSADPVFFDTPLIFAVFIFILALKFKKSPFDYCSSKKINQASSEGSSTGFKGSLLAWVNISSWYYHVLMLGLTAMFFAKPVWAGILVAGLIYLLLIIFDNICPTSTWKWTAAFCWPLAGLAMVTNIVWLYLRQVG